MTSFHLAQLNIAKMKFKIDAPEMVEFVDNLESINALAEASPGFIWRLQSEQGDATDIDFFGADILVNMSIWQDHESLHNYVYASAHTQIMSRRKIWFDRIEEAYSVLWWVGPGHIPSLAESQEKLELLKKNGASVEAFTLKTHFPTP